jgi:hypothetical protein
MQVELKDIEWIKSRVDAAFTIMNTYAQDPWDMGAGFSTRMPVDPQAILGEVYLALAPVSFKLKEIVNKENNKEVLDLLDGLSKRRNNT